MKVKKLSMPMLSVLIAILILSFCIVSTGFATRSNNKVELNKVSPEWYSERTFSSRPICNDDEEYLLDANLNKGKTLSSMSTYPVSISKSALLNQASIVVRGTVLGFDYLTIRHINGTSTLPYTDYYIDVHETLRGNAELDENGLIRLRTFGGENDKEILINDELNLEIGTECLLFLIKPVVGGGYETEFDGYYYPIALSAGVYTAGDETVKNDKGELVPRTFNAYSGNYNDEREIDYPDFVEMVAEYNKTHEVDEFYSVNKALESMRANVESGFMTQEEYDKEIANMEIYATIVE